MPNCSNIQGTHEKNDPEMLLQLRGKANELWETIVRLETEKYDLEERQKRQDYDVSIEIICYFNCSYNK